MNWHVDWQDGAALLLALIGLRLAWWLHRRFARPGGCARCPMLQEPARPTDRAPASPEVSRQKTD